VYLLHLSPLVTLHAAGPGASRPVLFVDIYYTQNGQMNGRKDDFENTKHRFWRHAAATRVGDSWKADLPLSSTDQPLWGFANVRYSLDHS
jgi:hypothetical protein